MVNPLFLLVSVLVAAVVGLHLYLNLNLPLHYSPPKPDKKALDGKRVDVIVPIHNEEGEIKDCTESILNQKKIEPKIFLVDDNSTDRSYEICKSLEEKYDQVNVLKRDDDTNSIVRTVKKGIENSNTEYVCSITCDVRMKKDAVSKTLSHIKEKGADAGTCMISPEVQTDTYLMNLLSNGKTFRQRFLQRTRELSGLTPMLPGAFYVVKREKMEGKLEEDCFIEDMSLTLDLYSEGNKITVYPEELVSETEKKTLSSMKDQFTRWFIGQLSLIGKYWKSIKEVDSAKTKIGLFSLPSLFYLPSSLLAVTLILGIFNQSYLILFSVLLLTLFTSFYRSISESIPRTLLFLVLFSSLKVTGLLKGLGLFIREGGFFKTSSLY